MDLFERCWAAIAMPFRRVWRWRWYEKFVAVIGLTLIGAAVYGWRRWTDRSYEELLHTTEPLFLGLAALSVVLLWAQMREGNIWNRLLTYHQFFNDVPSRVRIEALERAFLEYFKLAEPPSAYKPLSKPHAETLINTKGEEGRPGLTALQAYLNEFEQFCGAINVGMVDETYARELQGTRVIDAYFGFLEAINLIRHQQEEQAKARDHATSPAPFTSKYYLELQLTATRWHERRKKELLEMQSVRDKADQRTQRLLQRGGVPGRAKNSDSD